MNIDLHHMRHFVTVAEELHFGRAAVRLGMAQPPLSQSIKRLEAKLGFSLFERSRRKVELTPSGRVFLGEAKRTLAQAELAVRLAREAASDDLAQLTLTFVSAALYRILPAALRAYRAEMPTVGIRLQECGTDTQLAQLRDGAADLGFVHPPLRNAADLAVQTIHRDRVVAAVPASSELAVMSSIGLSDLVDERFVLFPSRRGPDLYGRILGACRDAGFAPRIEQEATLMHTILSMVAGEAGVSLVPDGARTMGVDGVVFVPITGLADDLVWELAIVWRANRVRRPLRLLIDTVVDVGRAVENATDVGRTGTLAS